MQERSDLNQLLLEMKDHCNALASERDKYRNYIARLIVAVEQEEARYSILEEGRKLLFEHK